ncbi:MAG: helix-turn-helix domain-containing protein [Chloroflexi bacterium]|nr:helix-turn-helix domain-containing protein [Chloroflexota bacterium]
MSIPSEWLPLSKAAAYVEAHPNTLRRWANSGQIPVSLTPGGHRRFLIHDLNAHIDQRMKLRTIGGLEQRLAGNALVKTQRQLSTMRPKPNWLVGLQDQDRDEFRALGRHLLGLTMQYVGSSLRNSGLRSEAEKVGVSYAVRSRKLGIELPELLRIMLFFRDTMMLSALELPDVANLRQEANLRIFSRMTELFNTVHLSVVEYYQSIPADENVGEI